MKRLGSCRQIHSWSLCVTITITLFLLTSCQSSDTTTAPIATTAPATQVFSEASYISARSIEELTMKSTLVVTGWATQMENAFNLARDVNDSSKPDPGLYVTGQIYQFKIDQILKGDKAIGDIGVISIIQAEGMFAITPDVPVTQPDIDKARNQYKYIPIRLNSKYLLFLKPLTGFNDLPYHFTGIAQPWRFDISKPDRIIPESPWIYAVQYFPPLPWSDVLAKVENPQNQNDQSTPSPYPAPSPYP